MKDDHDADEAFLISIDSKLISFLQMIIIYSIKLLAIFMSLLIIWSTVDVGIVIVKHIFQPPYFLMQFEDILGLFGGFLVVLIAIEIFLNIVLYMRKDMSHIKLVVATALMAISRKVIILDYEKVSAAQLYGLAGIIVALGIAYWLIKSPLKNKTQ